MILKFIFKRLEPLLITIRYLVLTSLLFLFTACNNNAEELLESSAATSSVTYAPAGTVSSFGRYLPPRGSTFSRAYSIWQPRLQDTCTKTQHDKYWVKGPDGSIYPTWHPPFEASSGTILCYYGHEHGSDPRTFAFYSELVKRYGGVPFGYVNEQQAEFVKDPTKERVEDHVGHKIEHAHYQAAYGNPANDNEKLYPSGITCDFLAKLHMGTHSSDAFYNHLHEYLEYRQCSDGTKMSIALLLPIQKGGYFRYSSGGGDVATGIAPQPAGSEAIYSSTSGERAIPQFNGPGGNIWREDGVMEIWTMNTVIGLPKGGTLSFGPYIAVFNSSRLANPDYNASSHDHTDLLRHTIDYCYKPDGTKQTYPICNKAPAQKPAWDSPLSPFNGTWRDVNFKALSIYNSTGQTDIYTDFYGLRSSFTPFPGSIKQYVAAIDNHWDQLQKKDANGKVLQTAITGSLLGSTKIPGDPNGAYLSGGFGNEYRVNHSSYQGKDARIHAPN